MNKALAALAAIVGATVTSLLFLVVTGLDFLASLPIWDKVLFTAFLGGIGLTYVWAKATGAMENR